MTTTPNSKPAGGGRMTLANVTRGRQTRPLRAIVYGVEGVGKSTFGASAPSPIFVCSEDGASQLDVAAFPSPRSWPEVLEALTVLAREEHDFKTLVIDTLDWLEPIIWDHVCQTGGKRSIEDFGYGKGYVQAVDQWRVLLGRIDVLVRTRQMHVVMLAHANVKRVEDIVSGTHDRYRMKLHDKASDLLREWADAVLFARFDLEGQARVAPQQRGKIRASGSGERFFHTQWSPAFDAKNRFNLPERLPLDWEELQSAIARGAPLSPAQMRAEIESALATFDEAEREKGRKALSEWAGTDPRRLAQLLSRVRSRMALSADEAAS